MIFSESGLPGIYTVDPVPAWDERGFFARTWCANEFAEHNLNGEWVQGSLSLNKKSNTLRGMHYQREPFGEIKLVRCTKGSIYDVVVDLRRDSPTYLKWAAHELSAENGRSLYVPRGFAHGFQTLEDNTEVSYLISEFYSPDHAFGVRWNDPRFLIVWPNEDVVISSRDASFPDFECEGHP